MADNITLTPAVNLATNDGSISYMIICTGNEVVDTAIGSCASSIMKDRGIIVSKVFKLPTANRISCALVAQGATGFEQLSDNAIGD